MTYSLNTLNASSRTGPAPRSGAARFGYEFGLFVGFVLLVFWLLALLSYSQQDAAWSTSGSGSNGMVANWGGRVGAWLADGSYFLLGVSVWWCALAAVRAWMAALARWMRGGAQTSGEAPAWQRRALFWGGLALLLAASTALEWSRLYRLEHWLPGSAGGVLGAVVGPLAMQWFGATGSALLGIVAVVLCVTLVLDFSWGSGGRGTGCAHRCPGAIAPQLARGRAGHGRGPACRARARGGGARRA